jgi:uncharacterized protein (DUF58 family)
MAFGAAAVTKLRYAQLLAASLAYLAARQHDAIGVAVFDEAVRCFRAPSTRSGQLDGVLHLIDAASPAHRTEFGAPLEQFQAQQARRGMVALLSDFYVDPVALIERVRPLAWQGRDVMLLQILDREERVPSLRQATLLQDMESGQRVEVSPQFMRDIYPARMQAHIDALREAASAAGMQHVLLDTSVPLQVPLRAYLLFRQRRR